MMSAMNTLTNPRQVAERWAPKGHGYGMRPPPRRGSLPRVPRRLDESGEPVATRDGTPLENAAVRLPDGERTVITDDDGRFEIADVDPGSHELDISSTDFAPLKRTVLVVTGQVSELSISVIADAYAEATLDIVTNGIRTAAREQVLFDNATDQARDRLAAAVAEDLVPDHAHAILR